MWHNRVLEVTHANNGGASKRNVESNVTVLPARHVETAEQIQHRLSKPRT